MRKPNEEGSWKKLIWNSEKKEFLGRTSGSSFKILLFYIIFYGCLTGIFIGIIQVVLLTIKLTQISQIQQTEIAFHPNDPKHCEAYMLNVVRFLEKYKGSAQKDDMIFENCDNVPSERKVCRFKLEWLGNCSGLNDETYGYKEGKPLLGFKPKSPENESLETYPVMKYNTSVFPVQCTDKDKDGNVEYFGLGTYLGFPLQNYPYYGKLLQPKYLQPLLAVQFTSLTMDTEIPYGENIGHSEKDGFQGSFDVKIEVKS
uniref:Sodium/potassium-transporting ATPase subunit beta n=1 Tax=Nomascus leucogenys TaxID=61853 RepID=A0A2I3FVV4_NOMLE